MNTDKKDIKVPPVLPCLEKRGLGEFLDGAFADIVWEHRDDIHDIVEAIIAKQKRAGGKGGKKAMKNSAGGAAGGPAYTQVDPAVHPPSASVRHSSVVTRSSRSDIEPITERHDSATTVAGLFEKASAECREAVAAIASKCKQDRKMFFDDSFYYDKRRNMYPAGSPEDCTVTKPLKCKRLRDLYPGAPLFSNDLAADDVLQGQVGDCFLIGAISALAAANPKMLKKLFVSYDEACGVYGVLFFKCGGWEWVIVDDNVAVHEERSGFCYPLYASSGAEQELWPMILEKAYAKMHYNWDIIDGGFAKEALVDLTGGLERTYDLYRQQKNMTFQQFRAEVDDPHTILGCAVGDHVQDDDSAVGGAGEAGAVFGLFHGHQYSVVGAAQASDGTGFVRVRNPWGNDAEWKGAYADNDAAWRKNPLHKQELKPEFKDDGAFWMQWEDFKQHMTQVDVVRTFPQNWKVLTMFGEMKAEADAASAYILQISDAKTKLAVTFAQDDPKMIHNSDAHKFQYTSYNALKMSIYRLRELPESEEDFEEALGKRMDSLKLRERSVYTLADFEPGLYCITPILGKGEHRGGYIRIVGPPDADYALWKWKEGEASRQVVGNCPLQRRTASGGAAASGPASVQAPVTVHRYQDVRPSTPSRPPVVPGNLIASPIRHTNVDGSQQQPVVATSVKEDALQKEVDDAQSYIKQLEALLAKQQQQLDDADRAGKLAVGDTTTAPPLNPRARLGFAGRRFDDAVDEVFFEVSHGQRTIEPKAAVNALRLIVTLGAGMDDLAKKQRQISSGQPIDREQFHALCRNVVDEWEVLQ